MRMVKLFLLTAQQGPENTANSNNTAQTPHASKLKSKLPNCSNTHVQDKA